ncbi:MAG: hypothetical protein ACI97N_001892 [Cognaticolwellia sp.]|jgi:hypothetical protein|tara:strand:- start:379 stop:618 length:240 start_codon:yes stop_codon:yes gene_type:complete
MSMTQIALLKKSNLPKRAKIENDIQKLGFDFQIIGDFENLLKEDGLKCAINANETFFEIYIDEVSEIANECEFIKQDFI